MSGPDHEDRGPADLPGPILGRAVERPAGERAPGYGPSAAPGGYGGYGPVVAGQWVEEESFIKEWLAIGLHRLPLIAGVSAVVLLATVLIVLRIEPRYTAVALVQLESSGPNVLTFKDVVESEGGWYGVYEMYRRTQIRLMQSLDLGAKVARRQRLDREDSFPASARGAGGPGTWLRALRGAIAGAGADGEVGDGDRREDLLVRGVPLPLVRRTLSGLDVQAKKNTRLVEIRYQSIDPVFSATMANAFADTYRAHVLESKHEIVGEARDFLQSELRDIELALRRSEENLNSFRAEHQVLSMTADENTTLQKLNQLTKALTEAQVQRIDLEADYGQVRAGPLDSLPEAFSNDVLDARKRRLADLEADRSSMAVKFKPEYPAMKAIDGQIDEVRASIRRELEAVARGMEQRYLAAQRREEQIRASLEEIRTAALADKDHFISFQVLQREVDTNRQLYNSLLQRLKETGIAASLQTSNISVVERAVHPGGASYPNWSRFLTAGAALGLGLGIGLAFLLAHLDDSLGSPEHASAYLGLPALGALPKLSRAHARQVVQKYERAALAENASTEESAAAERAAPAGDADEDADADGAATARRVDSPAAVEHAGEGSGDGAESPAAAGQGGAAGDGETSRLSRLQQLVRTDPVTLVSLQHGQSSLAEAFRILRTSLLLSSADHPPRTLLVTSAIAGEGKTVASVNIALSLAQTGMRGVLVDADLRRPRVHKALGLENTVGLTNYLAGQMSFDEVAQRPLVENLLVVPAGPRAPNPSELLSSRRMMKTLQGLRERCDFVVLDAPPVLPVADAVALSAMVEGVVLVADSSSTPKHLVRGARDKLMMANAKILGFVLNRVEVRKRHGRYSGYRSQYYGRYSYGYHDDRYGDERDSA